MCAASAGMKLYGEFGFVLRWEATILGIYFLVSSKHRFFFFPIYSGRICLLTSLMYIMSVPLLQLFLLQYHSIQVF